MFKNYFKKILATLAAGSLVFNLALPIFSAQLIYAQEASPLAVSVEEPQPVSTPVEEVPAPSEAPQVPVQTEAPAQEPSETAVPSSEPAPSEIPAETPLPTTNPNPDPVPSITPIPPVQEQLPEITPVPNSEATPTASIMPQEKTPAAQPTPTVAPEAEWISKDAQTFETAKEVILVKEYKAPQNDKVTIKFSLLSGTPEKLSIKEVKLSPEQVKQTGALSDTAYDITSNMPDGTFYYDLTLPLPPQSQNQEIKVKTAENLEELSNAKEVSEPKEKNADTITVHGLNHFTIFVVTSSVNQAAQAASKAVSPTNNANNSFPDWYGDDNGIQVMPCLDGTDTNCVLPAAGEEPNFDPSQPTNFPTNFPSEFFYWITESDLLGTPGGGKFGMRFAVEGAFLNDVVVANDQMVFGRIRATGTGLTPNSTYTVTHPYGVDTYQTDDTGIIKRTVGTEDIGCAVAPCNFSEALGSRVFQSFLKFDTGAPAGYLGDGATAHTITGAPTGNNFVKIEGPGLPAGGLQTNLFTVSGKLYTVQTPPPGGCTDSAPDAPVLVSPADSAAGANLSQILKWTAVASFGTNCAGNNNQYEVFMDSGNANPTTSWGVVNGATTEKLVLALASNTTYSWRVRAKNGVLSADSPVWTFTTKTGTGSRAVSTTNNANNSFPDWYGDDNDIQVMPCLDGTDTNCVLPGAGEEPGFDPSQPTNFPTNFPSEFFYWIAESNFLNTPGGGKTAIRMALEGAFLNDVVAVSDQMVFGRIRVTGTGLTPNSTYTVTHPYGVDTYQTDDTGILRRNVSTEDTGCAVSPCVFDDALGSRVFGTFLKHPNAPAGYLGDAVNLNPVVGSPTGNNFFRIEGPGLPAGGLQTSLFTVSGKLANTAPCVDAAPGQPTLTSPANGAIGTENQPALLSWDAPVGFGTNCAGNVNEFEVFLAEGNVPNPVTSTGKVPASQLSKTFVFPSLFFNTTYSWKVRVHNGALFTDSPVWTFTTKAAPVIDNISPVITVLGANPVDVTVGTPYVDPGATALDNIDGDITANIIATGLPIDTNTVGTYTVIYAVTDKALNVATATRTVNVLPASVPSSRAVSTTFDLDNNFPDWYGDDNSIQVMPCLDGTDTNCVLPAAGEEPNFDPSQPTNFPTNFPSEFFYWITESDLLGTPGGGKFGMRFAVEGAFLNDVVVANDQMVFGRIRATGTGLTPNSTYTVTHPYGVDTYQTDDTGIIKRTVGTEDIGCAVAPCNFSEALGSRVFGTFLRHPNAPVGYLGDAVNLGPVTGSPTGNNFVKIEGPGLPAGGLETNLFTVSGKMFNNVVPCIDTAPGLPALIAPANNESSAENQPALLSWGAPANFGINCAGNVNEFELFLAEGNVPNPVTSTGRMPVNQLSKTFDFPLLFFNTVYSWKVRVHNGALFTDSPVWTFTTKAAPVVDNTDPVITILGASPVDVTVGTPYVDAGATALDNADGDITANIVTAGLPIDTSAVGTHTVTYSVVDKAFNVAAATRTVNVITAPVTTGTITIIKDVTPGDPEDFGFRLKNGSFDQTFQLDDDSTDATLPNTQTFTNLVPGIYTAEETGISGWVLSALNCIDPDNGTTVDLNARTVSIDLDAGEDINCTFINSLRQSISGSVFNDLDNNGNKDTGELGLAGWTVYLDTNDNGSLDTGETSVLTDASGIYQFTNLGGGSYVVREIIQTDWSQTSPSGGKYSLTINSNSSYANENFGNFQNYVGGPNPTPFPTPSPSPTPSATPTPIPSVAPTPTPTPTPSVTTTSNNSSSDSNNNGGGSSASAVCNDSKPGSAPVLTVSATGENEVTLSWTKAADPVTYYLLAFGLSAGNMQYGNPNIGDQNTTSYTVKDLSGGTAYFFKVRAGNGCTPGDFSNEVSAIPQGAARQIVVPAGFQAGVLGTSTSDQDTGSNIKADVGTFGKAEDNQPQVLGAQNSLQDYLSSQKVFLIALAVASAAFIFNIIYPRLRRQYR